MKSPHLSRSGGGSCRVVWEAAVTLPPAPLLKRGGRNLDMWRLVAYLDSPAAIAHDSLFLLQRKKTCVHGACHSIQGV